MTYPPTRAPILYPKHFALYQTCPERYFHERVERRKIEETPSTALQRGIATHKVLQAYSIHYEDHRRHHGGILEAFDILGWAHEAMPREAYCGDETSWVKEINALISDVTFAARYLDNNPVVLATEATYQYPFKGSASCPPFVLSAKVDAVLLRHDEDGRTILEIIDWKGGATPKIHPIQELACRMVVQANARRMFSIEVDRFQTTTVGVSARSVQSKVITDEQGRQIWIEMLGIASAILDGKRWSPIPGTHCEWCPYFGGACSLANTFEDDDEVALWLDADRNVG